MQFVKKHFRFAWRKDKTLKINKQFCLAGKITQFRHTHEIPNSRVMVLVPFLQVRRWNVHLHLYSTIFLSWCRFFILPTGSVWRTKNSNFPSVWFAPLFRCFSCTVFLFILPCFFERFFDSILTSLFFFHIFFIRLPLILRVCRICLIFVFFDSSHTCYFVVRHFHMQFSQYFCYVAGFLLIFHLITVTSWNFSLSAWWTNFRVWLLVADSWSDPAICPHFFCVRRQHDTSRRSLLPSCCLHVRSMGGHILQKTTWLLIISCFLAVILAFCAVTLCFVPFVVFAVSGWIVHLTWNPCFRLFLHTDHIPLRCRCLSSLFLIRSKYLYWCGHNVILLAAHNSTLPQTIFARLFSHWVQALSLSVSLLCVYGLTILACNPSLGAHSCGCLPSRAGSFTIRDVLDLIICPSCSWCRRSP